jgi:hypothetical protein
VQPQFDTEFVGMQVLFIVPQPSLALQSVQLVFCGSDGFGFGLLAAAYTRPSIRGFVMVTRPSRSTLMS